MQRERKDLGSALQALALGIERPKWLDMDPFGELEDAAFVGRTFALTYNRAQLLTNDVWRRRAGGIPTGCFLVAVPDTEIPEEFVLLRAREPAELLSQRDLIGVMIEQYKDTKMSEQPRFDIATRVELEYGGLQCDVLGTYYRDGRGGIAFGADLDDIVSPHNYRVLKPTGALLRYIVNASLARTRMEYLPTLGRVRYTASERNPDPTAEVLISPLDFLGRRTAAFGMTRTGKSNTVKLIIKALDVIGRSGMRLDLGGREPERLKGVGQLVLDVNGEYSNPNQQDRGAVWMEFGARCVRYGFLEGVPGVRVLKLNFHEEIAEGFSLIKEYMADKPSGYLESFASIEWEQPQEDGSPEFFANKTRYQRRVACYHALLNKAGLLPNKENTRVWFESNAAIRSIPDHRLQVDPRNGLTMEQAEDWFLALWEHCEDRDDTTGSQILDPRLVDNDLRSLLQMLSCNRNPGPPNTLQGYRWLIQMRRYHTNSESEAFTRVIVRELNAGKLVLVDLSRGEPSVRTLFSRKLVDAIFLDATERFTQNQVDAPFIQLYFEEAHNLLGSKEPDNIYNRLAKEGQKYRLGMVYSTQEVSSIPTSILSNTQNWLVTHLNNDREIAALAPFYDFRAFGDSIKGASAVGFSRVKMESSEFVIPVQIKEFVVGETE